MLLKRAKVNQIDNITLIFSTLVGFYSVVLYGDVRGKLVPDITSKEYAELVARTDPVISKVSKKIIGIQTEMSSVPIV